MTEPAGATVWIDGEARGVTPLRLTLVRARPYEVEFRLRGYSPARFPARRFGADEVLRARLHPALDVTGATVALDPVAVREAPGAPDIPHVRIEFGREPDPESVLDALAVVAAGEASGSGPVVPGVATVSDDGLVWIPGRLLEPGDYLLILGGGARAADGSPIAEPYRLPFTVPELPDARADLEAAAALLARGFSATWTQYDGASAQLGPLGRTDLGKGLTRFTGEFPGGDTARLDISWDGGRIEAVRVGDRVAARYAEVAETPGPWTWFDLEAPPQAYRDVARRLGSVAAGAAAVAALPPEVPAEWAFLTLLDHVTEARLEGAVAGPAGRVVRVIGLAIRGWDPGSPGRGDAGAVAPPDPATAGISGGRYAGYRAEAWLGPGPALLALRWQQYFLPPDDTGPVQFRFGEARFGPAPAAVAAPVDPRAVADIDPVLEALHGFYQARLARDADAVLARLAAGLREEQADERAASLIGPSSPRYAGYHVTGYETFRDGRAVAGVNVVSVHPTQPYTVLEREQVTLRREGGIWRVAEVARDPLPWWTVLEDQGVLWVKPRGDAEPTRRLLALGDLPREASPAHAAPGTTFGVGRDGFGPLALAPSGTAVAGFSRGLHPVLFVADLEPGRLRVLDLYFEGGGVDLAWSPDAKWLAVRVAQPSGTTGAALYHVPSGAPVDLGLGAIQPPGGPPPHVTRLAWSGAGYALDLDAGPEGGVSRWRFDLRTGALGPR